MDPTVAAFFAGSTLLELGAMFGQRSMLKEEKALTGLQFDMQSEQQRIASLQNQMAIDNKLRTVLSAQNVLFGMQNRRRSGSTIAFEERSQGKAMEAKLFENINKSFAMSEINLQRSQAMRTYNQAIDKTSLNMFKKVASSGSAFETAGGLDLFVGGR